MKNKIKNAADQIKSDNLIILEGAISVSGALCSAYSKVVKIILNAQNKTARKIMSDAAEKNITVEYFSDAEFGEFEETVNRSGFYTIGKTHGGIIALTLKRKFLSPRDLIAVLPEKSAAVAVVEGIEDPYNLGYAVRALYTQGVGGLILPERDFGFSESVIEKASTGTFSKMPVAVFPGFSGTNNKAKTDLINILKAANFRIYCIDKKNSARDIFDVKFADKTAFIIGGEKRGISKDFVLGADETVNIPYANDFPHSLAAQTAATIVSYEINRQRNLS